MIRVTDAWPRPEEVATKSFTSVRRGFDPEQVRGYLARLSAVVMEAIERVTAAEDQLGVLGARAENETELRGAVESLQAQCEDLANRLTLATAMRTEALGRVAELELSLAAVDAPPPPTPGDELDRASAELAQILREARIRASHIRADAEREAGLIIEGAQRERRQAREEQARESEQVALNLREQLAAICRDAENRVAAAHGEAARILAEAEEHAARTIEQATFQGSRLVANAGDFTAVWLREAQQLSELGHLAPTADGATGDFSAAAALAAFQASMHDTAPAQLNPTEITAQAGQTPTKGDPRRADEGRAKQGEHAAQLLHQADQLLSIAEVLRRAEPGEQNPRTDAGPPKLSRNGKSAASDSVGQVTKPASRADH